MSEVSRVVRLYLNFREKYNKKQLTFTGEFILNVGLYCWIYRVVNYYTSPCHQIVTTTSIAFGNHIRFMKLGMRNETGIEDCIKS